MSQPWFQDASTAVFSGDSLDVLRGMADNSVDAVVTDPPYGLTDLPVKKIAAALGAWLSGDREFIPAGRGFMNASWDKFVPPPALWDEVFRVMKPGAYLLSFAGARTQDLMGMSIRLAGFRLKDGLQWIRADSFPKTKQALKSGYEPILMAQKPLDGTIAANMAAYGTGGLNIEASRTPFVSEADEAESKSKNQHGKYGTLNGGNNVYGDFSAGGVRDNYAAPGRWPTNLLLDEEAAVELDAANPSTKSRKGASRTGKHGDGWGMTAGGTEYDDEGGPSRFYPRFHYAGRATVAERPVVDGVSHSTVKPLSVMEWLVRLVTPEGGVVLDPFAGSGTTVEAARRLGVRSAGIEMQEKYLPLIAQRIARSAAAEDEVGRA